jgi:hypothetical protein
MSDGRHLVVSIGEGVTSLSCSKNTQGERYKETLQPTNTRGKIGQEMI